MDLIVTTEEQLNTIISNCITKTQAPPAPEPPKEEIEAPISQAEAAKFLGTTRQTLYALRKRGIIKAHFLGGRVKYFKSELRSCMK
jgi:excisionase family DNA binding protein